MNVNRLIWLSTTILFCLIGFLLGYTLGNLYVHYLGAGATSSETQRYLITATLAVGGAIVFARFGSWLSDRFLLHSLNSMMQVSAADRVLGIAGVLLGVLFAALITFPLPNNPIWLLIKLCSMAVAAVFGMALLQGMREEMLHVFPQLNGDASASTAPHCSAKLIDTNIIIDGRMTDLCKTGFIEGQLFVPTFVLEEVQYIADSPDSLRRARGRRGLEVLNAMRELRTAAAEGEEAMPVVQVISDFSPEVRRTKAVDSKLVVMAKEMQASIVTNDYNLNRVAELQGVQVLNINELVQALRPVVLPGEEMSLTISREGKEAGQGVGYLEDGTMVVVGEGRRHIGETCIVTISSVIQTVAGKMIFAEMKNEPKDEIKQKPKPGDDLFDNDSKTSTSGNGDSGSYRSSGGMRNKSRSR